MKICVDAGGSKVRLAVVDEQYDLRRLAQYNVKDLPKGEDGLAYALSKFVKEISTNIACDKINCIVVGAAGPVENNSVKLTNSPWIIEREGLINQFSSIIRRPFKVGLINDFEALAYGLDLVEDSDVIQLHDGKPRGNVKLVCGPGTGLGLSALRSLTPNRSRECPDISRRTAQAYMRLAAHRSVIEAECATVAHLTIDAALCSSN
jgi:glucokinase